MVRDPFPAQEEAREVGGVAEGLLVGRHLGQAAAAVDGGCGRGADAGGIWAQSTGESVSNLPLPHARAQRACRTSGSTNISTISSSITTSGSGTGSARGSGTRMGDFERKNEPILFFFPVFLLCRGIPPDLAHSC